MALAEKTQRKINELLVGSGIPARYRASTFETYRTDGKAEKAAVLEACREYAERFVENFQDGRCR
ncbi:ATP-binding protein, partial [Pseudomonas aeruginosa]